MIAGKKWALGVVSGVLAAMGVGIQHAGAAILEVSGSVPTTGGTFSTPFSVPEFDPSQGTLIGVSITYQTTVQPVVEVVDVTGTGGSFANANASSNFTVTGPGGYDAAAVGNLDGVSGTIAATGGLSFTTFYGSTSTSTTTDTVAPGDFGLFTGTGEDTYTLASGGGTYSGTQTGPAGQSNLAFGGNGYASEAVTVDYSYLPAVGASVPEPASLGLLATAAAAMVGRRRRV